MLLWMIRPSGVASMKATPEDVAKQARNGTHKGWPLASMKATPEDVAKPILRRAAAAAAAAPQ